MTSIKQEEVEEMVMPLEEEEEVQLQPLDDALLQEEDDDHKHEDDDDHHRHEEMIAEATAAAIEAAAVASTTVDVSAAANAAVLAAATAATLIDAADVPDSKGVVKNEQRRKRYREKTFDEIEAEFPMGGDDISLTDSQKKLKATGGSHEDLLAARRLKDRQRYATMTPDQRQAYNAKRREQYHRQSELSRQRRRERERSRYHALAADDAKHRNARRAKLERERYQKLSAEELESKNRKRRERAALNRQKKEAEKAGGAVVGLDGGSSADPSDVAAVKLEEEAPVVHDIDAAVEAAAQDAVSAAIAAI
jgi:hypothetical protein